MLPVLFMAVISVGILGQSSVIEYELKLQYLEGVAKC